MDELLNKQWILATLLTDGECSILGTRARIRVEWPDGPPFGWTEEQLRRFGEEMKAKTQAGSGAVVPAADQGWRPAGGSL